MHTNINNLFNWKDYVELNPDINNCENDDKIETNEAEQHWKNIGSNQMRLCNNKQLEVVNEFGNEIILYVGLLSVFISPKTEPFREPADPPVLALSNSCSAPFQEPTERVEPILDTSNLRVPSGYD